MYFRVPSSSTSSSTLSSTPTGRAVLIDTEPKVINKCLDSKNQKLRNFKYDPRSACCVGDGGGAGNNWARGNSLFNVGRVREEILDKIRREIERNDRLSSFHIISSLAGGTGSGLGCAVTSGVKDSFSSKGLCMNTVVSPFSSGEVIVQDYNAALTLASLLRSSDGIVVMDNEVAVRKCKKGWRIERPKMDDVNRVMAEGLGGALKESYASKSDEASRVRPHGIPTLVSHCVPHPSYKLLSILHVPTMPRESVEFTRDTWEGGVVGRLRQMSRTGCEVEQEIKWGVKEEMQKFSPSPHKSPPAPPPTRRTDDVWEVPTSPFDSGFGYVYPPQNPSSPFACHRTYSKYRSFDKHGTLIQNSSLPALKALGRVEGAMRKHEAGAYLWQYEREGVGEGEWEEVWNTGTEALGNYRRL
ncbi:hypothetical protein TrCOL_g9943 [Triparma columacea]|uniref:Tubulin delta chain n=1 Tax=Triparma columacea TaxID=722753 RepID=A0A9W7FWU8_9STRA|nr:hypothetical protein TrCOL_g9943 [Triparma columacea]